LKKRHDKVMRLLDEHGEKLHRLLTRLTMCENAAGDLIQELFIRLSGSKSFGNARNELAFAWTSAVNLAYDWRRKHRVSVCSIDQQVLQAPDDDSSLNKMIRAEQVQKVLNAAMDLKEPGRSVVLLRYIEQRSYEEIAETLGKKPSHIRSLCSKSIGKLRQTLAHGDTQDKKGAIA